MMHKSMQKSKKKQPNTCDWESHGQDLVEISRLNKITRLKQVLYYTPRELFSSPEGKMFHPCDWSRQDFEIGRYLGKGKYGHVYLARQRKHKMIMALKVISKKQIVNSEIIFQLRRQIQIHSHLQHANILKMYGYFYDQRKIYIILEYAPYGQLYKLLQSERRFKQQKSAKIIYQMIQALKYLHEKNIIHRDIKPENILLSIQDEVKLTDFGWSIHVGDRNKRRQTYCGTPDYICPEIAYKKDYDYRLDLWCLGVLAFQLNAGEPPFQNALDKRDLVRKIRQVDYKCPPSFSLELKNFISQLLRVKPEERMTADVAESHPWIRKYYVNKVKNNTVENNTRQQQKLIQI